jgi:glycosyltransferase involved in cell wall biosynthesis
MTTKTPNILLVAYQCAPGIGSVSQIGWEWFSRSSKKINVTLVTHIRNKSFLEIEYQNEPERLENIIFIDTEWFAGPLYKISKKLFFKSEHTVFLISSIDYFLFDWVLYKKLKRMNAKSKFDILHRVTPVTLAAPSILGKLGIPFFLGPLNSGLSNPKGFEFILKKEFTGLNFLRNFGYVFDFLIGSLRRANVILSASKVTTEKIPNRYKDRVVFMLENGVNVNNFNSTAWPTNPSLVVPLNILFVGRLVSVKALDLLIKAVANLTLKGVLVKLNVIGDGPMRVEWQELCKFLGISNNVEFLGQKSSSDVANYMKKCHVFCLPSIRESGGAVLLEAMASARPVIAMDFGGPSNVVDQEVGELIDITDPSSVVQKLELSLDSVRQFPDVWAVKGLSGRKRVEQYFDWDVKIDSAISLYKSHIR